jgi:hypothetical protein
VQTAGERSAGPAAAANRLPVRTHDCDPARVNREMMKEYRGCLLWVLVLLVCLLMIVFANQVLGWVSDTIG